MNKDKTAAAQAAPETPAQTTEPEVVTEEAPRPKIEKTLANCKPREFMRQSYRVKKFAEIWLTETDLLNIRKNAPKLPKINPDAPEEEQEAQRRANKEAEEKAGLENFSRMFDAVFGEHPDETLELLALCCFVEPSEIDNYEIADFLDALSGMLNSRTVKSFFTSFMSLARTIMADT